MQRPTPILAFVLLFLASASGQAEPPPVATDPVIHDGADATRSLPLRVVPQQFTVTWLPGIEEHWDEGTPAPRPTSPVHVGGYELRYIGPAGAPRFHTDRYEVTGPHDPRAVVDALSSLPEVLLAAPLHALGEGGRGPWRAATPRVLLQLTGRDQEPELHRLAARLGLERLERRGAAPDQWRLELPRDSDLGPVEAAMALHASPATRWAQVNWIQERSTRFVPTDDRFEDQWHLDNTGQKGGEPDNDINAVEAWDLSLGDPDIVIAVMDSGVDLDHPDLAEAIVPGYDFINGDDDPNPGGSSHGTSVAGLAGAPAQGIGVAGSCPGCSIMPLRMLGTSDETEAEALDFAATEGADIINNSWGPTDGTGVETPIPAVMATAIDNAVTFGRNGLGTVVLWAAGNGHPADTCDLDGFVAYPSTVAVGASTDSGERASYSELCPELDLSAPSGGGASALTTTNIGGYTGNFGGTSAACPVAAGAGGLLLSASPDLPWTGVREVLMGTAQKIDPGDANYDAAGHSLSYGYGRVDAFAALAEEVAFLSVAAASASCESELSVTVHYSGGEAETLTVQASSETESDPETFVLEATTESTFEGTVTLSSAAPAGGDGFLSVADGDTVLIESVEADESTGVPVDCAPPELSNPRVQESHYWGALVAWETDEESTSYLEWGAGESNEDSDYKTQHLLWALDLTPCTDYTAVLRAADREGNEAELIEAVSWTSPGDYAQLPEDAPEGADPCDPSTWTPVGDDDDDASGGGLAGSSDCTCESGAGGLPSAAVVLSWLLLLGHTRCRRRGSSSTRDPGLDTLATNRNPDDP